MYPSFTSFGRQCVVVCAAAVALLSAGCHGRTNYVSGYGIGWVTLNSVPGDYVSYIVNVDSVTLTDTLGHTYTALATVEPVDFTKLKDISELWGSATIPNLTYKSATITLDYTTAAIYVLVNGVPTKLNPVDATGAALKVVSVNVVFDPAHQLVVVPSYSTDNAQLLAVNFDLPASNQVNLGASPATVTVQPYMTVALAPANTKLIRVRGALINSSVALGTYTLYERPFYDQSTSIGSLTIFNDQNTVYTLDGSAYVGSAGLNALSQTPAGVTMTAAYTTFQPTATATAFAGKFNAKYVIAGDSLQSYLTENLSGQVIARSGNTLTLRGATAYGPLSASLTQGYFAFEPGDSTLLVGPSTVVTQDDSGSVAGLNYTSIAVGQFVEAVGTYSASGTGTVTLDATSAATGKVRLLQNHLYGQLLSASPGSVALTLQTINGYPAGVFNFAGNGTVPANDSAAADYKVSVGTLDFSATPAGTPLWIDGLTSAFGAAPPDFVAAAVNQEDTFPAQLQAQWSGSGTTTPFASLSSTGFAIDLTNAALAGAVLRIGPESVALATLPASPQIVPTATPVSLTAAPVFSPLFTVGTPGVPITTTVTTTGTISAYSGFPAFVTALGTAITATTPVSKFVATGYYNRATNSFTANTVDVVL